MSELLADLKSFFKTKFIVIDNTMARFHYKLTVAILIAFSILVTAKQYIGDPIDCVMPKDSIDLKMLDTYCWIHKTFSVKKAFTKELQSEVAYPGVASHEPDDELVYHGYYQWVCFVLFIQAMFFYVPRYIWKHMLEHKTIQHLLGVNPADAKATDLRHLECKDRDKLITFSAEYMVNNLGKQKSYFRRLCIIEVCYFANVILQMFVVDKFLGGEFTTYGWKVLVFQDWHWEARYDPMVKVFPRMTKCNFKMFGSGGSIITIDTLCVLPINIINEKIYLLLWFWFVGLAIYTACYLIYRLFTIFCRPLRMYRLSAMVHVFDDTGSDVIKDIVDYCDVADWHILYQLAKNMNPIHYRDFLDEFTILQNLPNAKTVEERNKYRRHACKKDDSGT